MPSRGGQTRCRAKKADGSRCKASRLPGSEFCLFHDPAHKKKGEKARREGGKTRSKPRATLPPVVPPDPATPPPASPPPNVDVKDVPGVVQLLADTISQVRTGALDPKIANATGYLANVLLRALEGSDLVKMVEEQAAALTALEQKIEDMGRERRRSQTQHGKPADEKGSARQSDVNQPDPRSDPHGPGGDIPSSGDDAGPLAGDIAPFFQ